jgi:linoleoyl-CoA desaturase
MGSRGRVGATGRAPEPRPNPVRHAAAGGDRADRYVRYRTESLPSRSASSKADIHQDQPLNATTGDAPPHDAFETTAPVVRRLKFAGDHAFHSELKRRVAAQLRATGRRERDCPEMFRKTAIIFATFVATYLLLVFAAAAWWQAVPLAIVLALSVVAIGFNVMHDASHHAYSDRPWLNRLMAMSLDLVGGSSHFWHSKHVVFHHTFVNVIGYDTDINLAGLGRLTPHHPWAWLHRWQHWYVWVLYGVMVIKWHLFDDFRLALTGRMGEHRVRRPQGRQLAIFLCGKVMFAVLAFALPLAFHPWWAVAATYALTAAVIGLALGTVFQLAHCVEEADFPLDHTPGHIDKPWAVHQVETTVDFARGSRAASWLFGGLNFQIEHHLFARICHVNYPAIAPVVEQTCIEFGVRYSHNATVWSALRSHYRWLRRLGESPAAP